MKLVSWNIAHREQAWRRLLETDADIALLQEAGEPPPDVAGRIRTDDEPWRTYGADADRPWRTAVVQLTDRVRTTWYRPLPGDQARSGDLAPRLEVRALNTPDEWGPSDHCRVRIELR